jgi:hypothetical protein
MEGYDGGRQVIRRRPVSLAKKSNRYREPRLEVSIGTTYRLPETSNPDEIPFVSGVDVPVRISFMRDKDNIY